MSQCPGDCTRIAREAAQTGEEVRLYACGGDGTLNEVVSGAAGFDNAAVTVFSGGSGNDFVKSIGGKDAYSNIEKILNLKSKKIDVIKVGENNFWRNRLAPVSLFCFIVLFFDNFILTFSFFRVMITLRLY